MNRPPATACREHRDYKAIYAPRSTEKHPGGCGACWAMWESRLDQAVDLVRGRISPPLAAAPLVPTWSEAINDWQRTTFGPATPERAWGRFSEEFEEMVEAECEPAEPPEKIAEEAADVVITLIGWLAARCPGQDLATAIERKMQINRARQWEIRGDGTGYHVKAGGAE